MNSETRHQFRLRDMPSIALRMFERSWPWAVGFVVAQTVLGTLSATVLENLPGASILVPVIALGIYCVWLLFLFRAGGLSDQKDPIARSVARLVWAHILVGFIIGMGLIILMLTMFLALPVMLIAAGVSTENYPETTEAFLSIMRETGTIWLAGALLAALCLALAYLIVRLWIFASATADRGQILVFQTWPWTRGHAPTLFAATALFVLLPLALAEVLYRTAFGWADAADAKLADIVLRSAFQSVEWVVPIVFAAAISAQAYRVWAAPRPDIDA